MIYDGIGFHNVAEMTAAEGGGFMMWRVPAAVRAECNEGLRTGTAAFTDGVELRFRMTRDEVVLHLRVLADEEAQVACIYYGSMLGRWQDSTRVIGTGDTALVVHRPQNMDRLREIHREAGLPFSPELVRVALPYGACVYLGVEGGVEPPRPGDEPERAYLAYGSSITHGSLALATPYTYAFRVAQGMGCDCLNMGFAGTAHLEKAMAEYLVSRRDWSFASLEMGINMLSFREEDFEARVDAFTDVFARDGRPVFATSIFGFGGTEQAKAARFREIVKKYAGERLIFTDGLELLNNPAFLSQDLVHPAPEGALQIGDRWLAKMRAALG